MSLKAFHVFFIVLSAIMCLGIGAFRAQAYADSGEFAAFLQAGVCFAAAIGLVVYAWRFSKKTKGFGYL